MNEEKQMKIAYTTETYLIKEITEQTPATRAVKINDLVQFVAYKDRNDYGGNFTQLFRLVVNGKKTKHILTESKMIDFLSYHTESINMDSIDLETFEVKDKIEVPLKDEFIKVETFAKKLKWNKSDLKTLLELTTDETIIDFTYKRSENRKTKEYDWVYKIEVLYLIENELYKVEYTMYKLYGGTAFNPSAIAYKAI